MQGMGLFTMEQCVYLEGNSGTQRGKLFTTGPGTYKIPSCQDIPVDFRVVLLGRAPNPKAIFSSKVRLSSTAMLAVRARACTQTHGMIFTILGLL